MPGRDELQEQLDQLRDQLQKNPPLSEPERQDLNLLMTQIEAEIKLTDTLQDTSLVDGVNLAVERFEVEHPTIAGTLRNIMQALVSMGI